jgi:hypothetical protein
MEPVSGNERIVAHARIALFVLGLTFIERA